VDFHKSVRLGPSLYLQDSNSTNFIVVCMFASGMCTRYRWNCNTCGVEQPRVFPCQRDCDNQHVPMALARERYDQRCGFGGTFTPSTTDQDHTSGGYIDLKTMIKPSSTTPYSHRQPEFTPINTPRLPTVMYVNVLHHSRSQFQDTHQSAPPHFLPQTISSHPQHHQRVYHSQLPLHAQPRLGPEPNVAEAGFHLNRFRIERSKILDKIARQTEEASKGKIADKSLRRSFDELLATFIYENKVGRSGLGGGSGAEK
jgi:hypothetical protein